MVATTKSREVDVVMAFLSPQAFLVGLAVTNVATSAIYPRHLCRRAEEALEVAVSQKNKRVICRNRRMTVLKLSGRSLLSHQSSIFEMKWKN